MQPVWFELVLTSDPSLHSFMGKFHYWHSNPIKTDSLPWLFLGQKKRLIFPCCLLYRFESRDVLFRLAANQDQIAHSALLFYPLLQSVKEEMDSCLSQEHQCEMNIKKLIIIIRTWLNNNHYGTNTFKKKENILIQTSCFVFPKYILQKQRILFLNISGKRTCPPTIFLRLLFVICNESSIDIIPYLYYILLMSVFSQLQVK